MSDLPKERCYEAASFTHCGVDMLAIYHQGEKVQP